MNLSTYKEKMIEDFDEKFPEINVVPERVILGSPEQIHSFLTTAIEQAYELGKKVERRSGIEVLPFDQEN